MSSLSFPDVNVWLALASPDHSHRKSALAWWQGDESETVAFCRITQLSLLRLLSNATVMNGSPCSMKTCWRIYEAFFEDPRVAFLPEPEKVNRLFKKLSESSRTSPKLWADAYLAAFALQTGAALVTFDRAMRDRHQNCLILD